MSKPPRPALGLTLIGKPIFEPNTNASGLIDAAMGGGKTTCCVVPAFRSKLADGGPSLFIENVKSGNISATVEEMLGKRTRKFAIVDDLTRLKASQEHRLSKGDTKRHTRQGESPR